MNKMYQIPLFTSKDLCSLTDRQAVWWYHRHFQNSVCPLPKRGGYSHHMHHIQIFTCLKKKKDSATDNNIKSCSSPAKWNLLLSLLVSFTTGSISVQVDAHWLFSATVVAGQLHATPPLPTARAYRPCDIREQIESDSVIVQIHLDPSSLWASSSRRPHGFVTFLQTG